MGEFIYRFLIGGVFVSLFAVLGDVLKPKSFAGLFGAAPSVALATLSLTIVANGSLYAALEARSMIGGAASFCVYAYICMLLMKKLGVNAVFATTFGLAVWLVVVYDLWRFFLR